MEVVGGVFGALLAVGLVMVTFPQHRRFARAIILASSVLLGMWCITWYVTTSDPMWMRAIIGLIVGAFVFVVVPESLRRLMPKPEEEAHQSGPTAIKIENAGAFRDNQIVVGVIRGVKNALHIEGSGQIEGNKISIGEIDGDKKK